MTAEPRKDKGTMTFTDGHNREVTRRINFTLDIRDFRGMAGFPWLVIAANSHLSLGDLWRLLQIEARENPECERPRSWIQRHRWMFQPPDKVNPPGAPSNRDGLDNRAVAIMLENPKLSAARLQFLLKDEGIKRSREWVRKRRRG